MKKMLLVLFGLIMCMGVFAQKVLIDNGPLRGDNLKYSVSNAKWDKKALSYYFMNESKKLPKEAAYQAVRNAFKTWENNSTLTFNEVFSENEADFKIGWHTGAHGDTAPFSGNVLAHAYYPSPLGGKYAGAIHFNDDKALSVSGLWYGYDLESIALHEIGHALGIEHSSIEHSVMYAYISEGHINRSLQIDDINAIWQIYGNPISMSSNKNIVCINDEFSYTLDKIPEFGKITWQAGDRVTLVSGQGTKTATFKALGNGSTIVKATVAYDEKTYVKENQNMWIGTPATPTLTGFTDGSSFTSNTSIPLFAEDMYGAAESFIWGSYGPITLTETTNGIPVMARAFFKTNSLPAGATQGFFSISVAVKNRCGTSAQVRKEGTVIKGIGGGGFFPDPFSKSLNSDISPTSIRIYTFTTGALVYHNKNATNFNIEQTTLNKGIYIVETTDESGTVTRTKVMKR